MRYVIFPEVMISNTTDGFMLFTQLRKKHRGKWYLQKFIRYHTGALNMDDLCRSLHLFNADIYKAILFGKINPNVKHPNTDEPLFPLDPDQRSEEERIKSMMP